MDNHTSKLGSTDFRDDSLLYCEGANRITQQFYADLHSFECGSSEWSEFVKRGIDCQNCIVQILCFEEIGKTGDQRWLEFLFSRSESERNATVLCTIYNAIAQLGGYVSVNDCAELFETSDPARRSAAMIVLYSMRSEDAVKILLKILRTDPETSLRNVAANRLAYLGSHAGLQLLLDSLEDQEFRNRVSAACALCALGNVVGINSIRKLLAEESALTPLERTNLVSSLTCMLMQCDVKYDPRDTPERQLAKSIFNRASKLLEAKASELNDDQLM